MERRAACWNALVRSRPWVPRAGGAGAAVRGSASCGTGDPGGATAPAAAAGRGLERGRARRRLDRSRSGSRVRSTPRRPAPAPRIPAAADPAAGTGIVAATNRRTCSRWSCMGPGNASIHWTSCSRYCSEPAGITSSTRIGRSALPRSTARPTSLETWFELFAAVLISTTMTLQSSIAWRICSAHGTGPVTSSGATQQV